MIELTHAPAANHADIVGIVEVVFQTMLDLETFEAESAPPAPGGVTVAVHFAGTWNGVFVFECPGAQALEMTARFLGIERPPSLNEEVQDALGELANMMAGNLKPLLGAGVLLSIPSVIQGADYLLRVCGASAQAVISFQSELGPFRVLLLAAPSPAEQTGR